MPIKKIQQQYNNDIKPLLTEYRKNQGPDHESVSDILDQPTLDINHVVIIVAAYNKLSPTRSANWRATQLVNTTIVPLAQLITKAGMTDEELSQSSDDSDSPRERSNATETNTTTFSTHKSNNTLIDFDHDLKQFEQSYQKAINNTPSLKQYHLLEELLKKIDVYKVEHILIDADKNKLKALSKRVSLKQKAMFLTHQFSWTEDKKNQSMPLQVHTTYAEQELFKKIDQAMQEIASIDKTHPHEFNDERLKLAQANTFLTKKAATKKEATTPPETSPKVEKYSDIPQETRKDSSSTNSETEFKTNSWRGAGAKKKSLSDSDNESSIPTLKQAIVASLAALHSEAWFSPTGIKEMANNTKGQPSIDDQLTTIHDIAAQRLNTPCKKRTQPMTDLYQVLEKNLNDNITEQGLTDALTQCIKVIAQHANCDTMMKKAFADIRSTTTSSCTLSSRTEKAIGILNDTILPENTKDTLIKAFAQERTQTHSCWQSIARGSCMTFFGAKSSAQKSAEYQRIADEGFSAFDP